MPDAVDEDLLFTLRLRTGGDTGMDVCLALSGPLMEALASLFARQVRTSPYREVGQEEDEQERAVSAAVCAEMGEDVDAGEDEAEDATDAPDAEEGVDAEERFQALAGVFATYVRLRLEADGQYVADLETGFGPLEDPAALVRDHVLLCMETPQGQFILGTRVRE
jgi:hypothetical protein